MERRPGEEPEDDSDDEVEDDPVTGREAAETALIEEGESESGAGLGDEID